MGPEASAVAVEKALGQSKTKAKKTGRARAPALHRLGSHQDSRRAASASVANCFRKLKNAGD